MIGTDLKVNLDIIGSKGLWDTPGPKGFFSWQILVSFGVIFTLISVATPQVSQKLMGCTSEDDLSSLTKWWYPLIGTIVVALAGFMGLYAAAKLEIASPDFVAGSVCS